MSKLSHIHPQASIHVQKLPEILEHVNTIVEALAGLAYLFGGNHEKPVKTVQKPLPGFEEASS